MLFVYRLLYVYVRFIFTETYFLYLTLFSPVVEISKGIKAIQLLGLIQMFAFTLHCIDHSALGSYNVEST